MSKYYYRGTSLSAANDEEFGQGRIEGYTATVFEGRLDMHDPQEHVPRGTNVADLAWWTPDGFSGDRDPYRTEQQGVTGGLTNTIGTAIGFSSGVPVVLYLDQSSLNGTGVPVRYGYDFFDEYPGAFSWVYGQSVSGEVHAMDEGLMAVTAETEGDHEVWEWGHRDLNHAAMTYEDEREVLVLADHIDIAGALDTVAIMLEGRYTPTQALATFDGYHAGYGDSDETDTSRWPTERVLSTLHDEVRAQAEMDLDRLVTINLTTTVMGSVSNIPESAFDYAFTDISGRVGYGEVEPFLLGSGGKFP